MPDGRPRTGHLDQALADVAVIEDAYYGGAPDALAEADDAIRRLRVFLEVMRPISCDEERELLAE